ncbi:hypothetical protein [Caudoviricetes sp.]|nr:hypothetical protein [Caudoviricetes sp.]
MRYDWLPYRGTTGLPTGTLQVYPHSLSPNGGID